MTSQKFIKSFFWFAFACFLSASIPHVAYFFAAFEPVGAIYAWFIAYGIAISIDVTIYLLSITVTQMHTQKKPRFLLASVWLFILALTVLSWYINGLYAEHFHSVSMLSGTTSIMLPFVGDINPLIASCFQVMVIAYTWIADKIASDAHVKTVEELRTEATELEQKEVEKRRIAQVSKGKFTKGVKGLVDSFVEVKNHAQEALQTSTRAIEKETVSTTTPVVEEALVVPVEPVAEKIEVLTLPLVEVASVPVGSTTKEEALLASTPSSNGHTKDIPLYTRKKKLP